MSVKPDNLDEQLSAYLDGELDPDQRLLIEQQIAADPKLAQKCMDMQRLSQLLINSADTINAEPLPASVEKLLNDKKPENNDLLLSIKDFFSQMEWSSPPGYALASLLLIAVIAPIAFHHLDKGQSSQLSSGVLTAGSPVKTVLDFTPSGQTAFLADAQITPLYSFKTHDNHFCRELTRKADDERQRAIACNSQGTWEIVISTSTAVLPDQNTYITASASDNDLINRFVDDNIAGDILSLDEEHKAMEDYSEDHDR